MTLKQAGEMYNIQKKKIDDVTKNLKILNQIIEKSGSPFSTCIIRTDILSSVAVQLDDHLKHLKYVMEKEIS